jgi:hypothetical protein
MGNLNLKAADWANACKQHLAENNAILADYIAEAEAAEGAEYWASFDSLAELAEDFNAYAAIGYAERIAKADAKEAAAEYAAAAAAAYAKAYSIDSADADFAINFIAAADAIANANAAPNPLAAGKAFIAAKLDWRAANAINERAEQSGIGQAHAAHALKAACLQYDEAFNALAEALGSEALAVEIECGF